MVNTLTHFCEYSWVSIVMSGGLTEYYIEVDDQKDGKYKIEFLLTL